MISGRGLGHTGGTLDKLESIPGFRTDLTIDEFRAQLSELNLAFIGQTDEIAPADRKAVRAPRCDGTVESIPLIASSIMSKKLASGLDALVLDVKVGAGAFMKKQVEARRLAQMMVGIGRRMGNKRVQALITDMDQPLGYAIGNALEVMEVSQTLQNIGPVDLHEISLELAARMIYLGKMAETLDQAREMAAGEDPATARLPQAERGDRGAGRQSAGSGSVRTAAERNRRARNRCPRVGLHQRHQCRRYRPRVRHDRRGPRSQGRRRSIPRWA